METQPVLVETRGRVGVITLNRPQQLNALNDALMDALGAALLAFDGDEAIGAIVITGSAKAFAAGADIAAMVDWTYMDVFQSDFITRNWETIRRVRKPVIAAVAGFALGGGCELALACDIVIAARHAARRRRHPATATRHRQGQGDGHVPVGPHAQRRRGRPLRPGFPCGAGAGAAGRNPGAGHHHRQLFTAGSLQFEIGGDVPEQIDDYLTADCLLRCIQEAITNTLKHSNASRMRLLFERRELHARFASADAHEGMRAFMDKRKPVFTHG